jgi:hypothetical protein
MQKEFNYLTRLFYILRMTVIILPLSHSYMDFYLIFAVFVLENMVFRRNGVDGYLSIFVVYYITRCTGIAQSV